jgi:hypothetical protein
MMGALRGEWPRVQVNDELIYATTMPPRRPTSYRYIPGSPGYEDLRSLAKQVCTTRHPRLHQLRGGGGLEVVDLCTDM